MSKIVKNTNEWIEEVLERINNKEYQKQMKEAGVNVVIKGAPDYPKVLMQYKEAPEFLFYKGNLPIPQGRSASCTASFAPPVGGRGGAFTPARNIRKRALKNLVSRGVLPPQNVNKP